MPPGRIMPPTAIKTALTPKVKTNEFLKYSSRKHVDDIYKTTHTDKTTKTSIWNKIKNFMLDLIRD